MILVYNYPNYEWYKYAYNLTNEEKNKDTLRKKIFNLFKKNEPTE